LHNGEGLVILQIAAGKKHRNPWHDGTKTVEGGDGFAELADVLLMTEIDVEKDSGCLSF
jgi:hypothetical protein